MPKAYSILAAVCRVLAHVRGTSRVVSESKLGDLSHWSLTDTMFEIFLSRAGTEQSVYLLGSDLEVKIRGQIPCKCKGVCFFSTISRLPLVPQPPSNGYSGRGCPRR
jgi:hypothetical protein